MFNISQTKVNNVCDQYKSLPDTPDHKPYMYMQISLDVMLTVGGVYFLTTF